MRYLFALAALLACAACGAPAADDAPWGASDAPAPTLRLVPTPETDTAVRGAALRLYAASGVVVHAAPATAYRVAYTPTVDVPVRLVDALPCELPAMGAGGACKADGAYADGAISVTRAGSVLSAVLLALADQPGTVRGDTCLTAATLERMCDIEGVECMRFVPESEERCA